jgi:hypothetical protein
MTRLLILLVLLIQIKPALATSCRDAISSAYTSLGSPIKRNSFSNSKFEELNISIEAFNKLDSEVQEKIYTLIKPLDIMTEETLNLINGQIEEVAGTYYEFFMPEQLELWRSARDELRSCDLSE